MVRQGKPHGASFCTIVAPHLPLPGASTLIRELVRPLRTRDPAGVWRAVAIIALVLNVLLLYLLVAR